MPNDRAEAYYQRVRDGTAAGRVVRDHGPHHLTDYLTSLVPSHPPIDSPALRTVLDALQRAASIHHARNTVDAAIAEFRQVPMIQFADGADLLLDTETFLNHLTKEIRSR